MAARVRRACYTEIGTSPSWTAAMRRVLATSVETLAQWMRPNDSLWTNINLAVAMTDQPREAVKLAHPMDTDPFAGIPGADEED